MICHCSQEFTYIFNRVLLSLFNSHRINENDDIFDDYIFLVICNRKGHISFFYVVIISYAFAPDSKKCSQWYQKHTLSIWFEFTPITQAPKISKDLSLVLEAWDIDSLPLGNKSGKDEREKKSSMKKIKIKDSLNKNLMVIFSR